MIGEENDNLMDELINMDNGSTAGKRYINRKQLVEIVTAMRRDGDEVEDILEALKDYIVDFKNTVDRPMLLPIIQDVDDGRYGPPRKWMPRDAGQVRRETGGYGASMRPAEPIPVDYQRMAGAAPFMAQSMGITEQIRDMYHKYIDAFQKGDLDSAMFYKNAFNELLEMRNSMYPGMAGQMGNKEDKDDWIKQLMVALVTNQMGGEKKPDADIIDQMEKLGRVKDIFGWGGPAPGGLSENAAIAAMQVAAPEIGKLTDTVGQLVNQRQQRQQATNNQATYEEMQDREREIRANYTACPQCEAVIPKWTKQCHSCGVLFNDQFAGAPSEYGSALEKRKAAGAATQQSAGFDPGRIGLMDQGMQVPSLPQPSQTYELANDYEDDIMSEQEEWFETYYPRLEEWISQGQDPRRKIQAVWSLADAHEQRQLLFIADQRGVDGLLLGLREYTKTHPEDAGALDFLMQSNAMQFLEAMFKEVRMLANEDNMMLSKQDVWQFGRLWPTGGGPDYVNPSMPLDQPMPMPMPTPQPQVPMMPSPQMMPQPQVPMMPQPQVPEQAEMLDQMSQSGMLPQGVPEISLRPPDHVQASAGESLKERLRRKQLGLE